MDAADDAAKGVKGADRSDEPKHETTPDGNPGHSGKTQRDKALDDLMAEIFFELDRAESEGPRNWLQLERRRAKRAGSD